MAFLLFTPLFNQIDAFTTTFVTDFSSRCIVAITPVVSIGLTLTFIFYGLLIIRGVITLPLMDFLGRSLRIALITSVALSSGVYQSHIAELIRRTPDELASALLSKAGENQRIAAVIDKAAGEGFDRVGEAFSKASFFGGNGLLYGLFGLIFLAVTALLTAIGAAFLLLAKLVLALLAGLGPLFILTLLWPATSRFFDLWITQLASYSLLIILVSAVFSLMMTLFGHYMADIKWDATQKMAYNLGGAVILSSTMVLILRQLPLLAAGLCGGFSLSPMGDLTLLWRRVASPFTNASAKAYRAARSTQTTTYSQNSDKGKIA